MKKSRFAVRLTASLLSGALLAASLTACDQISWQEEDETPPYPVTVGNVTVEKKPRVVGSLSPAVTRLLIDLGYQDRIVGYSDDDVIPAGVVLDDLTDLIAEAEAAAAAAPESAPASAEPSEAPEDATSADGDTSSEESSGITISIPADWDGKTPLPKEPTYYGTMGTALEPDMIRIGILKPEILFTSLPLTRAQLDQLDAVNIKVVLMPAITTLEELEQRIEDILLLMEGQIEDAPPAESGGEPIRSAATIAGEMTARLDEIRSRIPDERVSFLYFCGEDMLPATGDTLEGNILSLLGNNLAEGYTAYTVPEEELAALQPDVILYSAPLAQANLEQNALLQEMPAVANGRFLPIDQSELLVQTRDIVETVRALAQQLYPEVDFTPAPASSEVSDPA